MALKLLFTIQNSCIYKPKLQTYVTNLCYIVYVMNFNYKPKLQKTVMTQLIFYQFKHREYTHDTNTGKPRSNNFFENRSQC